MPTQRYGVTQPPIETLFAWIKSGEIAIPEIQRPFVWSSTKVRNLLDSLFQGYPVGYLIAWRNPNVRLKDGRTSDGKRILIDGQQRVTALMAALLGMEVVNSEYERQRIRIAFCPLNGGTFEVANPAIEKDKQWIADISVVFNPNTSMLELVRDFLAKNTGVLEDLVFRQLERLRAITSNQIGIIELNSDLDIETVTEIFIRVNSEGVALSQADFAMSKIAVNETYGGNMLRKAIDYFCHLAIAPEFIRHIENDAEFTATDLFQPLRWMQQENDDLYDPSYTDMLRVAFASEFNRGRLEDLVALLSGRNFETREYEDAIVEETFKRLKIGILNFMNETHFRRFLMILRSAGFVDSSLIGSQNAVNFGYVLYLWLRRSGMAANEIERAVRKWYVMSMLTGRYSSAPEGNIDFDMRQLERQGYAATESMTFEANLSETFWETVLPQQLDTSSTGSPYWRVFQAAQVKLGDKGFLSRDICVKDLVEQRGDVHHIFPKDVLKRAGMSRGQYNQIANFAIAQSEINIQIGNKEPAIYFRQLKDQSEGGALRYGNIGDPAELEENLRQNCIPAGMDARTVDDYGEFLAKRRRLMALKVRDYFRAL